MAYADEVLADAPLAYYPCQETSGTVLVDASGNGNDGAVMNGAVVNDTTDAAAPAGLGKHIRLDGVDDYLDLASSTNWLNVAGGFTFVGWFRVRAVANWQRFFAFATAVNSGTNDIAFGRSFTNNTMFTSVNGVAQNVSPYPSLSVWHQVAVTISNAGVRRIYIDGAQVGTDFAGVAPAVVSRPMKYVGKAQYTADALNPTSVTQVSVYGAALAPSRIAALYAAGTAVSPNVTVTAPTATATAQAHAPLVVIGDIENVTIAVPGPAAATAQAYAPTRAGVFADVLIAAPTATAVAYAEYPTLDVEPPVAEPPPSIYYATAPVDLAMAYPAPILEES